MVPTVNSMVPTVYQSKPFGHIRANSQKHLLNDEDFDPIPELPPLPEDIDLGFPDFFMITNPDGELMVTQEDPFLYNERNAIEPEVINFESVSSMRKFLDSTSLNIRSYEIRIPGQFYKRLRYDCRKDHLYRMPIKLIKVDE